MLAYTLLMYLCCDHICILTLLIFVYKKMYTHTDFQDMEVSERKLFDKLISHNSYLVAHMRNCITMFPEIAFLKNNYVPTRSNCRHDRACLPSVPVLSIYPPIHL